jgi:hypothetical protein
MGVYEWVAPLARRGPRPSLKSYNALPNRPTPSSIFPTSAVVKLYRKVDKSGSLKIRRPSTNATPCSIAFFANSPASFVLLPRR